MLDPITPPKILRPFFPILSCTGWDVLKEDEGFSLSQLLFNFLNFYCVHPGVLTVGLFNVLGGFFNDSVDNNHQCVINFIVHWKILLPFLIFCPVNLIASSFLFVVCGDTSRNIHVTFLMSCIILKAFVNTSLSFFPKINCPKLFSVSSHKCCVWIQLYS